MRRPNAKSRSTVFPLLAASVLAVALSPSAASASGQAQTAPENHAMHGGHEHSFAQIDTDHDGRISRAEFAAAHGGKSDRFASIDSNGDGFISPQEFDAHHAAMGQTPESHAPATHDEHADHH